MSMRKWSYRACTVALLILLTGCGGGSTAGGGTGSSGAAGSGTGGSKSAAVTGVSTPKSVSVVTAN